jgi:hypothetical protein
MPVIETSDVALRIGGDDLIPDEITGLLGASPSVSRSKGQMIVVSKKKGTTRIAKSGFWMLNATDREPEDINGQVQEVLSQMTSDLAVWQSITKRYRVDLLCGLFLSGTSGGLTLSPQSLMALAERGIELGLCIYSGDDDEHETST